MSAMGRKRTLLCPAPLSDFEKSVRNCCLKLCVVGVDNYSLAGRRLESGGEFQKEGLGVGMYRPRRFNAATACPLGWIIKHGAYAPNLGHIPKAK